MFQVYSWRGKPIHDIDKWAEERGERMVHYVAKRTVPDLLSGGLIEETEEGKMPQSFWSGLLWQGGWHYAEVEAANA